MDIFYSYVSLPEGIQIRRTTSFLGVSQSDDRSDRFIDEAHDS